MGVLPLILPAGLGPQSLALRPDDRIRIFAPSSALAPRARIPVEILYAGGARKAFAVQADVETAMEIAVLRAGGMLPLLLRQKLKAAS
jgi:aconitate hydratase